MTPWTLLPPCSYLDSPCILSRYVQAAFGDERDLLTLRQAITSLSRAERNDGCAERLEKMV